MMALLKNRKGRVMPINLVIRNVPDQLADLLRPSAAAHHRPLQGDLLAYPEESAVAPGVPSPVPH